MGINDRLSTILPTVGAFRRRSMQVKWLSCKGLILEKTDCATRCELLLYWQLATCKMNIPLEYDARTDSANRVPDAQLTIRRRREEGENEKMNTPANTRQIRHTSPPPPEFPGIGYGLGKP